MDIDTLRRWIIEPGALPGSAPQSAADCPAQHTACGQSGEHPEDPHWDHTDDCRPGLPGGCAGGVFLQPRGCPECRLKDLCGAVAA